GRPAPHSFPTRRSSDLLSWTRPSNGGATITAYRVYRSTGGALTFLTQLASTTSYKDTGTTRGASYTYAVSAVNSVGEGPQSNARSEEHTSELQSPDHLV